MEKLRFPACSRQTKRKFFTQFHTAWEEPFRGSLYYFLLFPFTDGISAERAFCWMPIPDLNESSVIDEGLVTHCSRDIQGDHGDLRPGLR